MNKYIKKFLICAPTRTGRTKNGLGIGLALKKLGHHVTFFDYDRKPAWKSLLPKPFRNHFKEKICDALNEELLNFVKSGSFDFLFCVKGINIYRETLTEISRRGVKTIGCWIDNPNDYDRSMINASAYDFYLTNDAISVKRYHAEGVPTARHFPSAVDPDWFALDDAYKARAFPISFVGTVSGRRLQVIRSLNDFEVHAFGPGWTKQKEIKYRHKEIFGDQLSAVFRFSKINLNIHNWFGVGSAMNLRLFEVPAAGGFLLTDWVQEIESYFAIDQHVVCWSTISELREKMLWYLSHEDERARIARQGRNHILQHHTYDARAQTLLNWLKH